MKRRICLVAITGAACLTAAAGTASAAGSGKTTRATCSVSTSIAIPAGADQVLPPASSGTDYGTARCGGGLGKGVDTDSFRVPGSGDTVAKYSMYFGSGTLHGTYDLSPQSGDLNFLATSWTGTMKVTGGTGAWKGVKGTGTMKCSSADGIHIRCKDKLKLKG